VAEETAEIGDLTTMPWYQRIPSGLITVVAALVLLFVAGAIFAPSSITRGALLGMLPFASVLAIASLGQTLVVQQGGIDLSVPGAISVTIVISTHQADGQDSRVLPSILLALAIVLIAGAINGYLISRRGLNPIIATLGMNALLYAVVLGVSDGIPRGTTDLMADVAGGLTAEIPNSVYFATAATIGVAVTLKKTVSGRRFEAVGANPIAAWAAGLRAKRHGMSAYVWAMVLYWLAGVLIAGIVAQPTAFQGDAYLLPTVAAVVLGGTSLLGGKGYPIATVVAALFLTQLSQFVLALGVSTAIRTLVQAGALAVGVALHTVDWTWLRERFRPSKDPVGASA
jgi:ribose transport system permease protein